MRIIGGTARGRGLKTPTGKDIRPTSDKVRLAIFNALFSRGGVVGKVVLDAFCGTGALGCEALSQGASKAFFFDSAKASLQLAKENVAALGFADRSAFQLKDATKIGPRPPESPMIDIAFLDPPYRKGLITPSLDALKAGGWINEQSIIIIETEAEAQPPIGFGECLFDKTYGETRVVFIG